MPKITPAYIKVGADGTATGVFPGGIEIPSAPSVSYPASPGQAVSWVRQSDGALVAEVIGSEDGTYSRIDSIAKAIAAGRIGLNKASARSFNGSEAFLSLFGQADNSTDVIAGAGAETRYLLRSDGRSDYVQNVCLGAFESQGSQTWSYTAPRPYNNVTGVFRGSGFIPSGSGLTNASVSIDGIGTIASTNFFWNVAGQHLPIILFAGARNLATVAATATYRLNTPGWTFDANDFFGGFLITY